MSQRGLWDDCGVVLISHQELVAKHGYGAVPVHNAAPQSLTNGPDCIPCGRGAIPLNGCDAMQPPGRQLSQQRKAEGLRRAVTASDEAITRYSRQIDAMATGLSRLIKRLEAIEPRLNRAGKRDPKE